MIEIKPSGKIDAVFDAPPSKAHTLRALFISSLASGKTTLARPLLADDQLVAMNALKEFGVVFQPKGESLDVLGTGGELSLPKKEVFVGNSGVTARFLLSFAALCPPGEITVDGDPRMRERPVGDLAEALSLLGVKIKFLEKKGFFPLTVSGKTLGGGRTSINAEISSQYFSSILISAPYAESDVSIGAVGAMRSRPYVDITVQMMRDFGVKAKNSAYKDFFVNAGQRYKGRKFDIEGDYSNSAYFFAAAAVTGGKVLVRNLPKGSAQGDKKFLDFLGEMGCGVKEKGNEVSVEGKGLRGITADLSDYPDIAQPLAVVAAFAKGRTVIRNVGHLRFKECDRLNATAVELKKIGAKAAVNGDDLVIDGGRALHGADIETYSDHRMAMSFAVAGLAVKGIGILGEDCVKKSFPDFFAELRKVYS